MHLFCSAVVHVHVQQLLLDLTGRYECWRVVAARETDFALRQDCNKRRTNTIVIVST